MEVIYTTRLSFVGIQSHGMVQCSLDAAFNIGCPRIRHIMLITRVPLGKEKGLHQEGSLPLI